MTPIALFVEPNQFFLLIVDKNDETIAVMESLWTDDSLHILTVDGKRCLYRCEFELTHKISAFEHIHVRFAHTYRSVGERNDLQLFVLNSLTTCAAR